MNLDAKRNNQVVSSFIKGIAILVLIIAAIGYVSEVDYYLMMPGTAEHLRPIIEVADGEELEEGRFMLTTVSSIPANKLFYTLANISNRWNIYEIELREKEEVLGHFDMDDELYRDLMLLYMSQSQQEAIYNAFLLANEEVELIEKAVLIRDVSADSMAVNILRPGDRIIMIDGIHVENSDQMINYVKVKEPGSTVHLVYERGGKQFDANIELMSHPESEEARIGIMIMTDSELVTNRDVTISTGRIGGSSAGMMFTLEIYNQLMEEDITKGYYIAGTGTINAEGNIGQIGGIKHKVKAARNANADLFFVPKDINPYDTNEQEALAANEKLSKPITIVAIEHIQDAIDYLDGLPSKQK